MDGPNEPIPAFRYRQPETRVFGGDDALAQLAPEVERREASRLLVVCGQGRARGTDLVDRLRDLLGERCAAVFDGVVARSPLPVVPTRANGRRVHWGTRWATGKAARWSFARHVSTGRISIISEWSRKAMPWK